MTEAVPSMPHTYREWQEGDGTHRCTLTLRMPGGGTRAFGGSGVSAERARAVAAFSAKRALLSEVGNSDESDESEDESSSSSDDDTDADVSSRRDSAEAAEPSAQVDVDVNDTDEDEGFEQQEAPEFVEAETSKFEEAEIQGFEETDMPTFVEAEVPTFVEAEMPTFVEEKTPRLTEADASKLAEAEMPMFVEEKDDTARELHWERKGWAGQGKERQEKALPEKTGNATPRRENVINVDLNDEASLQKVKRTLPQDSKANSSGDVEEKRKRKAPGKSNKRNGQFRYDVESETVCLTSPGSPSAATAKRALHPKHEKPAKRTTSVRPISPKPTTPLRRQNIVSRRIKPGKSDPEVKPQSSVPPASIAPPASDSDSEMCYRRRPPFKRKRFSQEAPSSPEPWQGQPGERQASHRWTRNNRQRAEVHVDRSRTPPPRERDDVGWNVVPSLPGAAHVPIPRVRAATVAQQSPLPPPSQSELVSSQLPLPPPQRRHVDLASYGAQTSLGHSRRLPQQPPTLSHPHRTSRSTGDLPRAQRLPQQTPGMPHSPHTPQLVRGVPHSQQIPRQSSAVPSHNVNPALAQQHLPSAVPPPNMGRAGLPPSVAPDPCIVPFSEPHYPGLHLTHPVHMPQGQQQHGIIPHNTFMPEVQMHQAAFAAAAAYQHQLLTGAIPGVFPPTYAYGVPAQQMLNPVPTMVPHPQYQGVQQRSAQGAISLQPSPEPKVGKVSNKEKESVVQLEETEHVKQNDADQRKKQISQEEQHHSSCRDSSPDEGEILPERKVPKEKEKRRREKNRRKTMVADAQHDRSLTPVRDPPNVTDASSGEEDSGEDHVSMLNLLSQKAKTCKDVNYSFKQLSAKKLSSKASWVCEVSFQYIGVLSEPHKVMKHGYARSRKMAKHKAAKNALFAIKAMKPASSKDPGIRKGTTKVVAGASLVEKRCGVTTPIGALIQLKHMGSLLHDPDYIFEDLGIREEGQWRCRVVLHAIKIGKFQEHAVAGTKKEAKAMVAHKAFARLLEEKIPKTDTFTNMQGPNLPSAEEEAIEEDDEEAVRNAVLLSDDEGGEHAAYDGKDIDFEGRLVLPKDYFIVIATSPKECEDWLKVHARSGEDIGVFVDSWSARTAFRDLDSGAHGKSEETHPRPDCPVLCFSTKTGGLIVRADRCERNEETGEPYLLDGFWLPEAVEKTLADPLVRKHGYLLDDGIMRWWKLHSFRARAVHDVAGTAYAVTGMRSSERKRILWSLAELTKHWLNKEFIGTAGKEVWANAKGVPQNLVSRGDPDSEALATAMLSAYACACVQEQVDLTAKIRRTNLHGAAVEFLELSKRLMQSPSIVPAR